MRASNTIKKALIITTVSGFLPKFELENVKLLQSLGYEVHYASNFHYPAYPDSYDYSGLGIHTHHIPIRKSPLHIMANGRALWKLQHLQRQQQFMLIHCHTPMGGVMGRLVSIGRKTAPYVIYTAHGFHFYMGAPLVNRILYYAVERLLAKRTDCLITINQEDYASAQGFRYRLGGFAAQIPGVGIDMVRFSPQRVYADGVRTQSMTGGGSITRDVWKIPADALFLLSVGELNHNKNHVVVLKAMRELKDSSIHYGICGTGTKRYQRYLKRIVRRYGLEQQVHFFGYQKEVLDYLYLADVFVFPSYREGLGMAALEAMAVGLPVIAADNRGTREYMIDGYNGCVAAPWDSTGFAKAILRMQNLPYRQQMGRCGRKQAEKFRKECSTAAMKRIYQKCEEVMLRRQSGMQVSEKQGKGCELN